jgi:hypothetical protein
METQSSEEQQVLIPISESRIDVKGSYSFWDKHHDRDAWWLMMKDDNIPPRSFLGSIIMNSFGYVSCIQFGENEGKYQADIPIVYDEETDSDCKILGFYETLQLAMLAVLKSNHPDLGGIYY